MRLRAAMRLCLLILPMPLAGCFQGNPAMTHFVVPRVDLVPCPGWSGPTPSTQRQFADATAATLHAKDCDERKMTTAAAILAQKPQ